jgi:hypothetical protein
VRCGRRGRAGSAAIRTPDADAIPCPPPTPHTLTPQDAGVGRAALAQCQSQLAAYTACAEAHLTAKQRSTWTAPQVYVAEAAGKGE